MSFKNNLIKKCEITRCVNVKVILLWHNKVVILLLALRLALTQSPPQPIQVWAIISLSSTHDLSPFRPFTLYCIVIVIRHLTPSQKVANKRNVLWGSASCKIQNEQMYKMNSGPLQCTCCTKYNRPAQRAG